MKPAPELVEQVNDYVSSLDDDPHEQAAKLGLVCVEPEANQLFLDIDRAEDLDVMEAMLDVLERNAIYVREEKRTRSKSGNWHVYLRMDSFSELDATTRVALQACLGSDRKACLLSLLRILKRTEREPVVFFEKPEHA